MDRRTLCAQGTRGGQELGRPLAPVIVPSSNFDYGDADGGDRYYETGEGFLYSRYGNPTVRQVEELLAALEGAEEAALFSSGMAAISAVFLTLAGSGKKLAAQRALYGGAVELLEELVPAMGTEVVWLDHDEIAELEPGRIEGSCLLYLETPVNPTLRLVDLRRAAGVARRAGVPVAVDGTFAPPVLQRPVELGVDLVIHSCTKYLGGHGDLIGGAVSGRRDLVGEIGARRRTLGGVLGPFSAFLLYRGLRTLAVRMEAHCRGAAAVARALAAHPRVERVNYPGLAEHPDARLAEEQMSGCGGMVSFTVEGGAAGSQQVHDRLRLFRHAGSLGGVESLVSIPARMSHRGLSEPTRERMGVPASLLRLSVGLEAPEDLVADLQQALDHSR